MDVTEAIRKRRSIKKYLDIPVEWDKIGSILDAGRLAPSAGNLQPWKFMVVLNQENRKKISEACFQQYWMQTAPVHIVISAEFNKMERFYGVRGERLYSIQSCAVAASQMMLEAINQGLACCFVSAFDEEMLKRYFKIPDFARPQVVLTIGYPAEEVPLPPKYTLNDIVHLEKFGNKLRNIMRYMGYGWGDTIQKVVEGAISGVGKLAEKGQKAVGKALGPKKESKQDRVLKQHNDPEDFRYRSG